MVIYKPSHAQLNHPLLHVDIDDAAHARTIWRVHFASFRHLLWQVAINQRSRWPERLVAFPPERKAFRFNETPYGFQLLVVRYADLTVYLPELATYPTQTYPARPLSGGPAEQVLVVDGWAGVVTGLPARLPHTTIQLEGSLGGIEAAAWSLLHRLRVVLDATVLIRDLRGPLRAHYDQQGWTGIEGLRRAAGSFREVSPAPGAPGEQGSVHDGGLP